MPRDINVGNSGDISAPPIPDFYSTFTTITLLVTRDQMRGPLCSYRLTNLPSAHVFGCGQLSDHALGVTPDRGHEPSLHGVHALRYKGEHV